MSQFDAISWAMKARGLSLPAYRLLMELAKRVGRQGFDVWPSQRRMATDCEFSVSSVRRCLDELVEKGLLRVMPAKRADGGQSSNVYRLQVRSSHQFADGTVKEFTPDFDDDGYAQDAPPPCSPVSTPLFTDEHPPLFTAEQGYEPESIRTRIKEDSPIIPLPTVDDIICDQFLESWNALAAAHSRIPAIRSLDDDRRKSIIRRTEEWQGGRGIDAKRDVWTKVFNEISGSRLLLGEKMDWVVSVDWILKKANFRKVMEENYVRDVESPNRTGRSAVAAGMAAIERAKARNGRRAASR